jgi:hypothetical protein
MAPKCMTTNNIEDDVECNSSSSAVQVQLEITVNEISSESESSCDSGSEGHSSLRKVKITQCAVSDA